MASVYLSSKKQREASKEKAGCKIIYILARTLFSERKNNRETSLSVTLLKLALVPLKRTSPQCPALSPSSPAGVIDVLNPSLRKVWLIHLPTPTPEYLALAWMIIRR